MTLVYILSGSLQLGLLDRLLRQCYEERGIRHEDPTSWYREPFVGLVKLGGGGWRRVRVWPYFERV